MASLNFRQGLVRIQSSGPPSFTPTFLQKSGGGTFIDLVVAPDPTLFTIAQAGEDYLFAENKSVSQAWGPFTINPSQSYWLYWDVDFISGVISRHSTMFAPAFGPNAPSSPAVDQHWYNTSGPAQGSSSTFVMNVWNGTVWVPKLRVFAAQYQNSTTIIPYQLGSQIGVSGFDVNAGYIIFDDANLPVQRFDRARRGVFIHTAMPLSSQSSRLANYSIESALLQAKAEENIPKHFAVAYSGPSAISLASNTTPQFPAVGIASEDMFTSEVRTYQVAGFVTDITWNWDVTNTQPAGTPLFVDVTGALTPNPPQSGSIQQIAQIVDTQVIYVNPQQVIQYG